MKKLLVIVDYQNDFVDGSLGFKGAEHLLPYIVKTIKQYMDDGQTIVFTRDVHDDHYLDTIEGKHLPIPHCLAHTKGTMFYGELESLSTGHRIFEKPTFGAIELVEYVRQEVFEEIRLMGLVSHICVLTNAILVKAALPNAHIIVDSNGSGSHDLAMEKKGYDILKNLHIDVL